MSEEKTFVYLLTGEVFDKDDRHPGENMFHLVYRGIFSSKEAAEETAKTVYEFNENYYKKTNEVKWAGDFDKVPAIDVWGVNMGKWSFTISKEELDPEFLGGRRKLVASIYKENKDD